MTLYQLGKRILDLLGLLDYAASMKQRWKSFSHRMSYRLLLLTKSKAAYMRYYDKTYAQLLTGNISVHGVAVERYASFRIVFDEMLHRKSRDFTIVETGCAHGGGWCHGSSSFLFFEFLNVFGGKLVSIDIDPRHLEACAELLETVRPRSGRARFVPMAGDSVSILKALPDPADFVYLDSWDLDPQDPEPSMRHHLAEFKAAKDIFIRSPNLIVAVDDNLKPLGIGKGKYVREWAQQARPDVLMDGYQLVLRLTAGSAAQL